MTEKDTVGNICKALEDIESGRRVEKNQIMMVRLDGHGFSKFTKGLRRPFDPRMSSLMVEVTKFLIEETGAIHGYTQSDEITLIWKPSDPNVQDHYFGGRFQKVASICAAKATRKFNSLLSSFLPEKNAEGGEFDARCQAFDKCSDALRTLQWREQDAFKNSISMTAHEFFDFKSLQGVCGADMIKMLAEINVDFHSLPNFFKFGTHAKRVFTEEFMSEKELLAIPEKHRPSGAVIRKKVKAFSFPSKTAHLTFTHNETESLKTSMEDFAMSSIIFENMFTFDKNHDMIGSMKQIINDSETILRC